MVQRAMTTGGTGRACRAGFRWRVPAWAVVVVAVMRGGAAQAFPFIDTSDDSTVPQGSELAAPDAADLRNQLQLTNGLSPPAGGGWTVIPRLDWQEMLTDNALQQNSPRVADLATFISPGIGVAADMPRLTLTLDYAPTLTLYARTTDLNALTQQLNGLATVTLAPDLLFVDLRAVAGVSSVYGGIGGLGTLGSAAGTTSSAQASIPSLAGNAQGLNRDNETQTTSLGVSPYLLRQMGDWGVVKLGDSLNVTRSSQLSGFFASPVPTGSGANGQTLVSNEENAHFVTGEVMPFLQDTVDLDLQQSQTTTDGSATVASSTYTSNRAVFTNQLTYALSPSLSVFVSGGHEDITYSNQGGSVGAGVAPIDDLTWSFGGTWAPNADSSLTASYGHQYGFNSLTVNGHYAVTPRTLLTASYGSTLGSQLEYVQSQLNGASGNGSGGLVNSLTGGALFGATNALAAEDGIFRTTTLTLGGQTTWDRDVVSVNLFLAQQTSATGSQAASDSDSKTVSVSWVHQMNPDMTLSGALSYAIAEQSGVAAVDNPGDNTSVAASLAWQWQISETLSGSVRYSFFERHSQEVTYDLYENMLILGISKRF
jgi:uncharacterized protein (PEP-CTERM system associated)